MISKHMNDRIHIVPVGTNCELSHRLRTLGARPFACPFDWNVTPVTTAIEMILDGWQEMLAVENLTFLPPENRQLFTESGTDLKVSDEVITPVVCRRFKILYPHDFSSNGLSDLPHVREKYVRRFERLMHLLKEGNRVLLAFNDVSPNSWQSQQFKTAGVSFPTLTETDLCELRIRLASKYGDAVTLVGMTHALTIAEKHRPSSIWLKAIWKRVKCWRF